MPAVARWPFSPRPPVSELGAPITISCSSARTMPGSATAAAPLAKILSPALREIFICFLLAPDGRELCGSLPSDLVFGLSPVLAHRIGAMACTSLGQTLVLTPLFHSPRTSLLLMLRPLSPNFTVGFG